MRFYQILLAEAANYDQLLSQFNDKLKIRFGQDNSIDNHTDPMTFITWLDKNINPTSKHEVLQWIIKTYVDGGIRLSEDLSRTKVALAMYFKYKNAMPSSLNSIKKLNDLESMVEKYGKQSEKSAAVADTRGYAKETTEVIYNGQRAKSSGLEPKVHLVSTELVPSGVFLLLNRRIISMIIVLRITSTSCLFYPQQIIPNGRLFMTEKQVISKKHLTKTMMS